MAIAVNADLVAGCGDLGGEGAVALDLLADEVEGRLHAGALELAEDRRRPLGMRAVVERERDAARQAKRDSEHPGDGRRDRRGGGSAPCAGGAEPERRARPS